jgi:hypothetical protein
MHSGDRSPADDGTGNSGGGCSVWTSFGLDDFTQLSWYTCLYTPLNTTILETNQPPLDEQLPSLRANHLEALRELEKVDHRIQSIRPLPSEVIAYRNHLQIVVDDYRSVLSTLRRVPAEIIHRILDIIGMAGWGRAMTVEPPDDLSVMLHNGPWRFSKVCQFWRDVAIRSPEFWTNIQIYFQADEDRASRGLCALLEQGIVRSGSWGLLVGLNHWDYGTKCGDGDEYMTQRARKVADDEGGDEDCERKDSDVIKAVLAHSLQIRELEITAFELSDLNDILPSSSSSRFSSLRRLCIRLHDECYNDGSAMLKAFEGSPFFTELKLDGLPIETPCRFFNFPWDQLKIFEHTWSISVDDMLNVMRLCPRLQKYIGSHTLTDVFTEFPSHVHHPALTYLELSADSLLLLRYITLPCLTTLQVSDIDSGELEHLTRFISRSQCSIQELNLSPSGTALQYDPFLELLPSLTSLTLVPKDVKQLDEFKSALPPERLPHLRSLTIRVWKETRTNADPLAMCTPQLMSSFIQIIQSRSHNVRSISFCLKSSYYVFEDSESTRGVDSLRAVLAPYNQILRARIQGGTKLHFFLGAFL